MFNVRDRITEYRDGITEYRDGITHFKLRFYMINLKGVF